MIKLRFAEDCEPQYMTEHSAACDLYAREGLLVPAGKTVKVPVGVWIESVDWDLVPALTLPELQIRARSGLSFKHGIMLANGVGTVDIDYPDEVCVLLFNSSDQDFVVEKGMRIGQMALGLLRRIPGLKVGGTRTGGFGSTRL